ncbi:hypothetical protein CEXT_110741 [Caerostris extrusa]|uniref:Uncharacterized protein n=1 Tax=Caerostris extrusa TaxID=172846 RepID=A0AAV4Y2M4_CAEEX|nr:hypothetical protein CEXT_110741 [Caerostris extrusa]
MLIPLDYLPFSLIGGSLHESLHYQKQYLLNSSRYLTEVLVRLCVYYLEAASFYRSLAHLTTFPGSLQLPPVFCTMRELIGAQRSLQMLDGRSQQKWSELTLAHV